MCHPVEVYLPYLLARALLPTRVEDKVVLTAEEKQTVAYTDALEYTLDLPDLVANKKEVAGAILQKHGWQAVEGVYVKNFGGACAICDLSTGKIRVSVSQEELVRVAEEMTKQMGVTVPMLMFESLGERYLDWRYKKEQEKMEKGVKEKAAKQAEAAKERMREKVEATLHTADESLRKELTEISVEYYAESVKEKAREMGEITEMQEGWTENHEEFSMTIELTEHT
jgi:hypothetical protein